MYGKKATTYKFEAIVERVGRPDWVFHVNVYLAKGKLEDAQLKAEELARKEIQKMEGARITGLRLIGSRS